MAGPIIRRSLLLLLAASASLLVACGSGGGGGSDPLPPLPPVPVAPSITTQPSAVSVLIGQSATFTVTATGTSPQYQWRKDGTAIAGATSAAYTLAAAALVDNGAQFSVVVSNSVGSETSTAASLTVTEPVVAPSLVRAPTTVSVVAGGTATFDVVAAGTAPLTYQWLRGGVIIPGAVQASYSLVTTLSDNNAEFSVRVTNAAGTVTSTAAALTVTDPVVAPSLVRAPTTVSVVAGGTATFDVVAAGTAPLTYQWLRGGVIIPGAVQASYSLVTVLSDNNAEFSVRVTNAAGTVTSPVAPLRVSAQFVPVSIAVQPADVSVRAGQNATFSVTLTGTGPFTWRWFRDGVNTQLGVDNTFVINPSLVFAPAQLSDNGARISLQVTDSSGTVTTRQAVLTVLP